MVLSGRVHRGVRAAAIAVIAAALGVGLAVIPAQAVPSGNPNVVGFDQEPSCLNRYLTCGGLFATSQISGAVLAGAFRQLPDFTYEPVLVESVDVETGPFALTYHLKPAAEWSDGVPVSADDLLFTFNAIMDPANSILSRAGYDLITSATKIDAKTVEFVFSAPYPPWKSLFPQLMPAHELSGQDFDNALISSIPVASGPFVFESWQRGVQLTLARNYDWWGPHDAYLEHVVFRFILDANARFQALANGELALLVSAAAPQLLDLPEGIDVSWIPAAGMEHLDLNMTSSTMPLLAQPWFRRALAYALDRDAAVAAAYDAYSPGIESLHSLVYLSQQPQFVPHFAGIPYDPDAVEQIMDANGCTIGGGGVWTCAGTRASVKFATTTGNAILITGQNALIASAQAAGIELVPDNSSPGELFGNRLPNGNFELVMFLWVRSGDPQSMVNTYGCNGAQNYMDYCSSQVTALLQAADVETNESARAALVNQADGIMAQDVPSLPLYQTPTFVARWQQLQGVVANASAQGVTWNIEDWQGPGVQHQDPNPNPFPTIPTDAEPAKSSPP
jgi:peptide/nickel transport system substrate-binding protein